MARQDELDSEIAAFLNPAHLFSWQEVLTRPSPVPASPGVYGWWFRNLPAPIDTQETADELRAKSHLKAAEYSIPVLGLIFLKFADSRFTQAEAVLAGTSTSRRVIGKANYQARGILYLPEKARFANLLQLKEGENLGKAINDAMAAIEEENPPIKGILPRTYQSFTKAALVSLLRSVNAILGDIEGDAFGKVYEYFLGKFAIAEGAKGGEYFTPTSIGIMARRCASSAVQPIAIVRSELSLLPGTPRVTG